MHPEGVINEIKFSILSEQDVLNESVLEITNPKLQGDNTVQDARLGSAIPSSAKCPTCLEEGIKCRGHFGHIRLNYPIFHPLFEKYILKLLKLFCFSCFRAIRVTINKECIAYDKINKWTDKKYICPHCGMIQPTWSFVHKNAFIQMQTANKTILCTPYDIRTLFINYYKEDLEKIGVICWPENMIIVNFPIIPPCARPSVYSENKANDDHLTVQYTEIVKANLAIDPAIHPLNKEHKQLVKITTLIYRISALFLNTKEKGKDVQGYRQRICGKTGLLRENLMGKRVDQSGRTVIGPEPTLTMDQVAVPEKMARQLTTVENVCATNIERLEQLKSMGKINFVNSSMQFDKLKYGDVVERQLCNGDYVIINRQPSLHKGSKIAFKTVISPAKTICFNLCNTKSFNADFDGDEMNIHVPQSPVEIAYKTIFYLYT